MNEQCACRDPQCPVCEGKCKLQANGRLYRIDQIDFDGTPFCAGCGEDALDAGQFVTEDERDDNLENYACGHASFTEDCPDCAAMAREDT